MPNLWFPRTIPYWYECKVTEDGQGSWTYYGHSTKGYKGLHARGWVSFSPTETWGTYTTSDEEGMRSNRFGCLTTSIQLAKDWVEEHINPIVPVQIGGKNSLCLGVKQKT